MTNKQLKAIQDLVADELAIYSSELQHDWDDANAGGDDTSDLEIDGSPMHELLREFITTLTKTN